MNGNYSESYARFQELVESKGITPYKVAKETGVTTATLTSWKQGKYVPKTEKLTKIAEFLDVDVSYILNGITIEVSKTDYSTQLSKRLLAYYNHLQLNKLERILENESKRKQLMDYIDFLDSRDN